MLDDRTPTHIAYALKREGKRQNRWLEIGKGYLETGTRVIHVVLDLTPWGGFNGYVHLSPLGVKPGELSSLVSTGPL
jgi:hypothetical protein